MIKSLWKNGKKRFFSYICMIIVFMGDLSGCATDPGSLEEREARDRRMRQMLSDTEYRNADPHQKATPGSIMGVLPGPRKSYQGSRPGANCTGVGADCETED